MTPHLLPRPRHIEFHDLPPAQVRRSIALLGVTDPRVERAALAWRDCLSAGCPTCAALHVAVDSTTVAHPDGYRLHVRPERIELVGGSPTGCFHGIQTLQQLTAPGGAELPCCGIEDHADFAVRGLLHDVTRGKVPTLRTLQGLIDRLASLKCNQLQLYIEHAFTFSFDPDICDADHGLTPDEIRELDSYCHERFIDLVPAVATLGHMGRILSMPRYRHLAETEATQSWERMTWPQRARGFTLDVANPESQRLVERIWNEVLDAFSSPVVNLCGDEPWDLGKGKNKERFAAGGTGTPYIDHILRTHSFCAGRGRRTQVWSDVVGNHPDQLHRLPRDLTVLHWGYDDKADYDGTARFVGSGLATIVCPGTSGWKRVINALGPAERNIVEFARAGRRHGAVGLLNTDWGDHGHFNALACSWHGIALGAALAWDADHAIGAAFDEILAGRVLGRSDAAVMPLLREASKIADDCETWRLLWTPALEIAADPMLPTVEGAEHAAEAARRCAALLDPVTTYDPLDRLELMLACRFTEALADKIRVIRATGASPRTSLCLDDLASAYAEAWSARNKPSGLTDILTALERVAKELESVG